MREAMLVVHFIGLAMGLGTGLSYMFLSRGAQNLLASDRNKFAIHSFVISRMGNIGLVLLFISGGYLMTPFWSRMGEMPLLIVKLVLFLCLGAVIGIISANMRKAKAGKTEVYLKKIEPLGKIAVLLGISIVILAVLVFH